MFRRPAVSAFAPLLLEPLPMIVCDEAILIDLKPLRNCTQKLAHPY
jgi:hypothetical protein